MLNTYKILCIDDNPDDIELIRHSLEKSDTRFLLTTATSKQELLSNIKKGDFDLVLTDFNILGYSGLDVINNVQKLNSNMPIIVVTGTSTEEIAIKAMKSGASDYIIKTLAQIKKLPQAILTAIKTEKLKKENEELTKEIRHKEKFHREIFESFPDIYYRTDKNMIVTAISPFIRNYGYEPDEILGTNAENYYVDPEEQSDFLTELIKVGSIRDYTIELTKKSGEIIFVSANTSIIYDENGEMAGVQGVLRDITGRVQNENRIKQSEMFATSLNRISRIMVQTDSFTELIEIIGQEVKNTTGYGTSWFYTIDENAEYARLTGAAGKASKYILSKIPMLKIKGDPYLEKIFSLDEIDVVEDALTDPNTDKEIVKRIGNRTIINVPVNLSDQLLGSMGIGTFGDEGVKIPTRQQKQYFMSVASSLAFTVDRIRLQVERQKVVDDLNKKNFELSNYYSMMIDRENRMVELKQEVNELLEKLGLQNKYNSPFGTIKDFDDND